MKKDSTPPPKLTDPQLYAQALQWMITPSDEKWQEGLRYLDTHRNAFTDLPPERRFQIAAAAWISPSRRFEKLRLALAAGCRWSDQKDGNSLWETSNPSQVIFSGRGFHSAAQWLELFQLGGGVPWDAQVEVPITVTPTAIPLPLWEALAIKAQEDAYYGRAEPHLSPILATAKAKGIPVEGTHECHPLLQESQNIAQILFRIGVYRQHGAAGYMSIAHQALLDANVDLAAVWENASPKPYSDHRAFKADCDALGKPIRAALLSGASREVEKDLRKITCLGQLPQLVKGIAKAGASEELLQACDNLPPYYREKYRHTIASLPRLAPTQESALSNYAHGGAA